MTRAPFDVLPKILPATWRIHQKGEDGAAYVTTYGLAIIASVERHGDRDWLHVSCSRRDRLPSWADLKDVKDVVIGQEKKAIQVLPPKSEYVNLHPNCLHLYHCLDGDTLPDFTQGTGML